MAQQMTVGKLRGPYQFVSDSQDVAEIKHNLGRELAGSQNEFDSFFVVVEDGDYSKVWGMTGIVPLNSKRLYRIR